MGKPLIKIDLNMNNNESSRAGINLDITPKNDIVFKKIFGSKGNEGILKLMDGKENRKCRIFNL